MKAFHGLARDPHKTVHQMPKFDPEKSHRDTTDRRADYLCSIARRSAACVGEVWRDSHETLPPETVCSATCQKCRQTVGRKRQGMCHAKEKVNKEWTSTTTSPRPPEGWSMALVIMKVSVGEGRPANVEEARKQLTVKLERTAELQQTINPAMKGDGQNASPT